MGCGFSWNWFAWWSNVKKLDQTGKDPQIKIKARFTSIIFYRKGCQHRLRNRKRNLFFSSLLDSHEVYHYCRNSRQIIFIFIAMSAKSQSNPRLSRPRRLLGSTRSKGYSYLWGDLNRLRRWKYVWPWSRTHLWISIPIWKLSMPNLKQMGWVLIIDEIIEISKIIQSYCCYF